MYATLQQRFWKTSKHTYPYTFHKQTDGCPKLSPDEIEETFGFQNHETIFDVLVCEDDTCGWNEMGLEWK